MEHTTQENLKAFCNRWLQLLAYWTLTSLWVVKLPAANNGVEHDWTNHAHNRTTTAFAYRDGRNVLFNRRWKWLCGLPVKFMFWNLACFVLYLVIRFINKITSVKKICIPWNFIHQQVLKKDFMENAAKAGSLPPPKV